MILHPDEVLTCEQPLDVAWGWDHPVATWAVDRRIAELRRALHDDAEAPQFIATLIGQEHRFIGRVQGGR